jgi:release factor glutamine methyltransferase
MTTWTIRSALSWANGFLAEHGSETPRLDAEIILAFTLHLGRTVLYKDRDQALAPQVYAGYRGLIERRAQGEPVAYIVGEKEFYGLAFKVNPCVLIPRPETEILVDQAIALAPKGLPVLEIGVGSGAVLIAILAHRPDLQGIGVDISQDAVRLAKENAILHRVARRISFIVGDALNAIAGKFHLIVMNPPYIGCRDAVDLKRDVMHYEPEIALFSGNDGLDVIRKVFMHVPENLAPGGRLIMETGYDQQRAIEEIVGKMQGFKTGRWIWDLSGTPRVVIVEREDG